MMWWKKPLDIVEPEVISVQGADTEKLVAAMCVASVVEIDPQTPEKIPATSFYPQELPGREVATLKFVVVWDPIQKEGRFEDAPWKKQGDLQSLEHPRWARML